MEVLLNNISKRYLYEWIIRDLSIAFPSGSIQGITGINGSGKSTVIKMISGFLSASKGDIEYSMDNKNIGRSDIYKYISLAAPYTDLINEYDAGENFQFHTKFKNVVQGIEKGDFLEIVKLDKNKGKQIQYYSSGMKQRLQLGLAILTDAPLLLLDEPTSYLDKENKYWFYDLLSTYKKGKTIIIASNDEEDFQFCEKVHNI